MKQLIYAALFVTTFISCNGNNTGEIHTQTSLVTQRENKYPEALYLFKRDNLYGYINYLGEVVIEPKFKFAMNFNEENSIARVNEYNQLGNQFGFIGRDGSYIITPQYPNATGFYNGLAVVSLGGNAGFINSKGEMIIEYGYSTVSHFTDGVSRVSQMADINGYRTKVYGYIDQNGKEIIPVTHKTLGELKDGRILYLEHPDDWDKKVYCYFDKTGKKAFTTTFKQAGEFYGGRAYVRVKEGEKWSTAFINTKGEVTFTLPDSIRSAGEGITFFKEGFAFVTGNNGKYAIIDSLGNLISNFIYSRPSKFSEGLAPVEIDGKAGYVDYSGNMVIEAKFQGAEEFKNGIAWIYENNKYGLIDKQGNYLHKPTFRAVHGFRQGLALVQNEDGTTSYIDENGELILKIAGDSEHFQISTMI